MTGKVQNMSNYNLQDFLKNCGVSRNNLGDFFLANQRKLPAVSFNKLEQNFTLFYPGPNDLGQLSFTFEFDDFILAFNQAKFKHDTPKIYYSDLVSSFQNIANQKINDLVKYVFVFFSLTPTLLKQAVHQDKKRKRKIKLYPKLAKINAHFKNISTYS